MSWRYYFQRLPASLRRFDEKGRAEKWSPEKQAWTGECSTEVACILTRDNVVPEQDAMVFCEWTRTSRIATAKETA